jgi:hypothetical protein
MDMKQCSYDSRGYEAVGRYIWICCERNVTYKNVIQEAQALCAVECRIDVEDVRLWCQGSAVQCMKMMKCLFCVDSCRRG